MTSLFAALSLAAGGIGFTATAAHAAQTPGCSIVAGVPYKSGSSITGRGSASCTASAYRTFIYQVHRSEGWWHPNVAQGQDRATKTRYAASALNCDVGSGSGTKQYFGQSFFTGWDPILSGNTGELTICG